MSTLKLLDENDNILAEIVCSDDYVTSVSGSVTEEIGFAVITGPTKPADSSTAAKPDGDTAYKPDDSEAEVPNE